MVDEFTNFNLYDIVTPIDVDKLSQLLWMSNYDTRKTQQLIDGFTSGFNVGYRGPINRQDQAKNLPFRGIGSKLDMWNKIMKEIKCGRYAGPYDKIRFQNYMQLPIGLVPKAGGKTRLIFHLSFDFGEKE